MLNPSPDFWRGRRVLVTGHTGFKGTWLTAWLRALGADVTGFALAPHTSPSMFNLIGLREEVHHLVGDVRDFSAVDTAVRSSNPSIVFHLAAQPLVRASYDDPVGTYATNVLGTANVLQASRSVANLEAVVVVTSDKCYAEHGTHRHHVESDAMGGHDPYSSSKGCAELVASAFRSSFFAHGSDVSKSAARVATVRAGNVIGGGDWATDRLIPDMARAVSRGEAVQIRNPHAVRPWQHVLEPLCGYLLLAEALVADGASFEGGWNFGPAPSDAQPVSWIVERLAQAWGEKFRWNRNTDIHPREADFLMLDITKARTELGYEPRIGLAEALKWVASWYDAHERGADVTALTSEQIRLFCELATVYDVAVESRQ